MEGVGKDFGAFAERIQSDFVKSNAHPPHPTQSQLHQSRYVGYPSTSHPFTVKREASPALSESSMRSRESYGGLEVDPAVTSPAAAAGHPPRVPSPAHNNSTDVNQLPDSPPRRRGHRRAQSEIALRLPDEASFERELGVEMPALSDDGTEDLFSMYIDMEQINNNYGAPSGKEAGNALLLPPTTSHHSRSLSVDALAGLNRGGSFSTSSEVRRPRHQHSNSMDGSTSFDFEGSDGKKAMASAKLSEIALIDPKRAKRYGLPSFSLTGVAFAAADSPQNRGVDSWCC